MRLSENKLRNVVREEIKKVLSEASNSDQIERYVEKFFKKMSGSTEETAKTWVKGIGKVSPRVRKKIWSKIKEKGRFGKQHDGTVKIYRPKR